MVRRPQIDESEANQVLQLLGKIPENLIVCGFNEGLKKLQDSTASALLLSSDFHPQIFGKQIIRMARRNRSPIKILAIDNLRWNDMVKKILVISEDRNSELDELLQVMDAICKAKGYEDDLCRISAPPKKSYVKLKKTEEKLNPVSIAKLHLVQPTSTQRAFVPKLSIYATKPVGPDGERCEQYISLGRTASHGNDKSLKCVKKSKPKKSPKIVSDYCTLTVNRIQGNPDRKKRNMKK